MKLIKGELEKELRSKFLEKVSKVRKGCRLK